MIKCLVKECNANVNGESSVVLGLAIVVVPVRGSGLRVLKHPLALTVVLEIYASIKLCVLAKFQHFLDIN